MKELSSEHLQVTRRQQDDLPEHVKGQAYFEEASSSANTRYYINTPKKRHIVVEFICTIEGEDYWTTLHWSGASNYWYTATEALIKRDSAITGWWKNTDPQHPQYIAPEESPTKELEYTNPLEEVISGGLHHLATLQGSQSLEISEPILPQIEAAVASGLHIPLDIPPASITVATSGPNTLEYIPMSQPAQASVSQSGQTITVAASTNGGLKGTPPAPFDRDRKKSHAFLVAFAIYHFANQKNEAMSNAATCVTTCLTFMQGDMMEPWKEEQMIKLQVRLATGMDETDEDHWVAFEQDFKDSFTNTNRKNEAFNELTALRQKESLDIFISKFKQLATAAGVKLNDHGTIYLFKKGLKPALVQAIIASQGYNPQNSWMTFKPWKDAAHACHLKWLHSQEFRRQSDARREGLYKALNIAPRNGRGPPHPYNQGNHGHQTNCGQGQYHGYHRNRGHLTTSQGGDYMDIDAIAIQGPDLSNTQKSEYMAANKCFYCTKIGHHAKDCCKKQADQNQGNGRAAITETGTVKAPNTTTFDITPDDIANFLKDNVDTIDPNTKLSIVEKILPMGFLIGPN